MLVEPSGANPRRLCRLCRAAHDAEIRRRSDASNAAREAQYRETEAADLAQVMSFAAEMAAEGSAGLVSFRRGHYSHAEPAPSKKGWVFAVEGIWPFGHTGWWGLTTKSKLWMVDQAPVQVRVKWWQRQPPEERVWVLIAKYSISTVHKGAIASLAEKMRQRDYETTYRPHVLPPPTYEL
jgi:hypothetical protein